MCQVRFVWLLSITLLFLGCTRNVPKDFSEEKRLPLIDPDYVAVTIPPNIAPLNFTIREPGDAFAVRIRGETSQAFTVTGKTIDIPLRSWRRLLNDNIGKAVLLDVYTRQGRAWKKFETIVNPIAADAIDPWISYRLIEPGYETFREVVLNQRNLENFDEHSFYRNELVSQRGQCANCHSFQNRRTANMLFHVRRVQDGTILIRDGKPEKVDLKVDETVKAGAYPAWHPELHLVAFSSNDTTQVFHGKSSAKVEVYDKASELVLYDIDRNEISHILNGKNDFEIYPAWSQDGNWLYYCCAHLETPPLAEEEREDWIADNHTKFKYNLLRLAFDRTTKTFGSPEMLVDAASMNKSATHPRPSPDGRYVMYCLADFGCFPIWHKESDLWLLDLETGETCSISEVNSPDTDSFHNWSSNGRWFVFSSRRDDGSYTRLYFAYFSDSGEISKPFLLPQKTPFHNIERLQSYNIPELMVEPIRVNPHELLGIVNAEPSRKAVYRKP